MRNPPNYGSIVNLGKNRRRPLGVRVPDGYRLREDFTEVIKYKYIGYFENTPQGRKDARLLLAQYNEGINVKIEVNRCPTFKEVADDMIERYFIMEEHKKGYYSGKSEYAYRTALKKCKPIHDMKINCVKPSDIQAIADTYKEQSSPTISVLKRVIWLTFERARKERMIPENFIDDIDFLFRSTGNEIHKVFTDYEIELLWKHADDYRVKHILNLIYCGMRIGEYLSIETKNIHIDEQYLIGGFKTTAGRNRTIPIADKTLPFWKEFYNEDSEVFIKGARTHFMSRQHFVDTIWMPVMEALKLNHIPHDTRYTCATLLDRAEVKDNTIKFILGHKQQDITNDVYIHQSKDTLLRAINSI